MDYWRFKIDTGSKRYELRIPAEGRTLRQAWEAALAYTSREHRDEIVSVGPTGLSLDEIEAALDTVPA